MTLPPMATIPAGEFWMGESLGDKFANDTERPRHLVRIARPFELAIFPVTNADFHRHDPAFSPDESGDLPATRIDWPQANAYCERLGARLPTEAEWEYACRAGSTSPFQLGIEITLADANFLYSEAGERIGVGHKTPTDTHAPNAFGLEAMHGNVCEWCADAWRPNYEAAPRDGSASVGSDPRRVIRGGAWDYLPRLLRSSWRDALLETTRRDNVGFRLARDLP